MKKIAILTATRAEYGLLKPIIRKLTVNSNFDVDLLVTGAHLSERQGLTYKEIEKDGFEISYMADILTDEDTPEAVSKSMALAIEKFAIYFAKSSPNALLVLGDRYETLAVCLCAINFKIPIVHLHGGEITEGAIDDVIRHAITKLAQYHFTSTEEYRNRVIQMGEEPNRVHNVGALGVENVLNEELMTLQELCDDLEIDLRCPYVVVTYHPVTLEDNNDEQIEQVLEAISKMPEYNYIITGANADCGGKKINEIIESFANENENVFFVQSLGLKRYLTALKNCAFVMGNSSSGIIEAPSFGIPTVNIGNRQQGRMRAKSVIDCEAESKSIVCAMNKAKEIGKLQCTNPYGNGKTSDMIIEILEKIFAVDTISIKKKFYDIEVS